jgi:hypothetical protein
MLHLRELYGDVVALGRIAGRRYCEHRNNADRIDPVDCRRIPLSLRQVMHGGPQATTRAQAKSSAFALSGNMKIAATNPCHDGARKKRT